MQVVAGLGLTRRVIIDQHFRQRDRIGRLLTALAYNPFAIGIGLDEDTAAFIGPDETLHLYMRDFVMGTIIERQFIFSAKQDTVAVCPMGRQAA